MNKSCEQTKSTRVCKLLFRTKLKATTCTGHLFFRAGKPGGEASGTNAPLIMKDGEHMLPHDKLHHGRHMLTHDKHQAINEPVC